MNMCSSESSARLLAADGVDEVLDVRNQTPPLLDDDERRQGLPVRARQLRPHEVALDRHTLERRVGDLLADDRLRRRGNRPRTGGRRVVLVLARHLLGVCGVLGGI